MIWYPARWSGGIGYSILLALGTALIQRQLRHSEALYGQFAFVLGLIVWLYLVSQLTMYAAELNVVRARRLWPRSILQPPLTEATSVCCATSRVRRSAARKNGSRWSSTRRTPRAASPRRSARMTLAWRREWDLNPR